MKVRIVRMLGVLLIAGTIAAPLSGGVAGAAGLGCLPKAGKPPYVCVYQNSGENIIFIRPTKILSASLAGGKRGLGATVVYRSSGYGISVYCNTSTHTYRLVYLTGGSTPHERKLGIACLA